ncbi:MAG TPA: ester cyclase [Gaiellaceae bacterium]|nr:ester cyclase [Gaiellaceae bacterium]
MASERNKRLARRALEEIYEKGDLGAADELVHPEFVDHEPAHPDSPTGPESVKRTVRSLHEAFADLRFEVRDEIAEGDKVVQLVVVSGRHVGPLMGRAPTGREFAVRHVYVWRIAGGRIAEHRGSRDDLGLLGQLGLLPAGGGPEATSGCLRGSRPAPIRRFEPRWTSLTAAALVLAISTVGCGRDRDPQAHSLQQLADDVRAGEVDAAKRVGHVGAQRSLAPPAQKYLDATFTE